MQLKMLLPAALSALSMGCANSTLPVTDVSKTTSIEEIVKPLWEHGTVHHLSPEDFAMATIGSSPVPVFVDFYADWYGPCKNMVTPYERAAKAYSGKASFAKYNIDEDEAYFKEAERRSAKSLVLPMSDLYRVEAFPTVLLFNKGEETCRFVGYSGERSLRKNLESCFKKVKK